MGPCAVFLCVKEAVVEAVAAALPEFDGFGNDAIATPEVGLRDVAIGEFVFQLFKFRQQHIPRGDDLALIRDPRAEAAADGAAHEIGERFGSGDFFDWAGDLDLAGERDPWEK